MVSKRLIVGAIGAVALVVSCLVVFGPALRLDMLGGTVWQFGFGAKGIAVNNVGGLPWNPMYVDPDGNPYFDMRQGSWGDHCTIPGVAVSFDLPGRSDSNGNPVDPNAAAEANSEYEVLVNSTAKEHYWLYYYSFGYVIKTSAKSYPANTGTSAWNIGNAYTAWESGTCDIKIAFAVNIQQSIFSNVSAYFADVKIIAQHTNIQDFDMAAYHWLIPPKCDPIQEIGSRVDITDEVRAGNHYTCTLNAHVLLTGGLQKPSVLEDTVYPFDVTFQRKMLMGVLLKQPLVIGQGSTETTTTPTPPPDYTWVWIVVGLIVLFVVCYMVLRLRRGGKH